MNRSKVNYIALVKFGPDACNGCGMPTEKYRHYIGEHPKFIDRNFGKYRGKLFAQIFGF